MPQRRSYVLATTRVAIFIFATLCARPLLAQHNVYALKQELPDSLVFRTFCKQYFLFGQAQVSTPSVDTTTGSSKVPLLTIHGNVRYDFLYRSYLDTPYAQRDFRQHTIQTNLQVTVKDKYPMRVNLVARTSNSPFFRNFLDANLQFDRYAYQQKYRERLLNRIKRS